MVEQGVKNLVWREKKSGRKSWKKSLEIWTIILLNGGMMGLITVGIEKCKI